MGLGDMVALALGGYAFVATLLLTRDRMVRWGGYEMLFVCGVAGVMLLILTSPTAIFAREVVDFWPGNMGVLTVAGVLGIPVGAMLAFAGNNLPGMEQRSMPAKRSALKPEAGSSGFVRARFGMHETIVRPRRSSLLLAFCACLSFIWPTEAYGVQLDETDYRGKRLLTMSTTQTDRGEAVSVGTSVLSMESRANLRRFAAATPQGMVYSDWYDVLGNRRWVAFDERERKFRLLAPRVKVVTDDYATLTRIAADLGAVRTKVLERLGHAVVWLQAETDPAKVANELKGNPKMTQVEIQFEKLPVVPM